MVIEFYFLITTIQYDNQSTLLKIIILLRVHLDLDYIVLFQ